MEHKAKGEYRPVTGDDKKITRRERRLGRVVVNPQVNYTRKEWIAKKQKEAKERQRKGD